MRRAKLKTPGDRYGIQRWGQDFFDVLDDGTVGVKQLGPNHSQTISLLDVLEHLKAEGIKTPVVVRFPDILRKTLDTIYAEFNRTIKEYNYQGKYEGVYPIKVNQQAPVIEAVARFGEKHGHGFEAGSKPELIIALAHTKPGHLLILNGYKDADFIELGLMAKKIGINAIFVVESLREIPIIIQQSKKLKIKPTIGLRFKLSTIGDGMWKNSGGDKSVFGLNSAQIVDALEQLRKADMLDTVKLLHYHLGSQLPDIAHVRQGILEAARLYVGLFNEGAPMGYLDVGGGLAVDYDGSHSNRPTSMNYSLSEYCATLVEMLCEVLDHDNCPHPTIVTEAGRATIAMSSVLITNVLDATRPYQYKDIPDEIDEDAPESLHNIRMVSTYLKPNRLQECYHDILHYRDDILQKFRYGKASLKHRALAEKIFYQTLYQIYETSLKMVQPPKEILDLRNDLASIYYLNLSVFQSLPDKWAINQTFPVMPIHRLNEQETELATLSDITCDCDGKIDTYVNNTGVSSLIPVHELKDDHPYYLAFFLVGAYQETLGDLHNLFGDTDVVSVAVEKDGKISIESLTEGDSILDVLTYVEFDSKKLLSQFRKNVRKATKSKPNGETLSKLFELDFKKALKSYTYHTGEL